jgi:hypothetical protein
MCSVNTSFISDARILAQDVLSASTDSIEKGLSRNSGRVIGTLILGPPGFCMCDSSTDSEKLAKINAKLMKLESSQLDQTSEDYTNAVSARDFQKQIYVNVRNYTETAQKIKNLAGFGLGLVFVGGIQTFFGDTSGVTEFLINSGYLIGVPTALYGIYNSYTEGNQLVSANQALARQAWPSIA